jgi:hypothetical protein
VPLINELYRLLAPGNQYRASVPEIEAKFQESRLVSSFPTEWLSAKNISYVVTNLIAMKEGAERCGGPLLVQRPSTP